LSSTTIRSLPAEGVPFDLADIARALQATEPYTRDGHAARTLIRVADLRIVVVALSAGKRMAEHHASVTAAVQVLSGRVRLELDEGNVALSAGQLLVLEPELAHAVAAEVDSVIMLTLGWRAAEPAEP